MRQDERLRKAVDSQPVPRDLEARVRTRLSQRGLSGWGRLVSSFALLIFVLVTSQFYAMRKTRDLMRVGLDDHLHCAIEGAYPRQTNKAEAISALGPYSPMLQPVLDRFPGDTLVSAHRCTVNGRAYVHFILRRDQTTISVILTRRGENDVLPRMIIPVHENEMAGYSVASFPAGGYLGYVISTLPCQQNDLLAGHVIPVIRRYTGA